MNSLIDIITTSGPGTGKSIDQAKVEKIHSVLSAGKQMGIASGVKFNEIDGDNVTSCLPYCDWFIVASSLEITNGKIDARKVRIMADYIH
jgi:predicted TIM-barrel enzyme